MQEIFISYSSKDERCADEIVAYLEERGFSCFIAHRDIKAGEEYDQRLIDAVEHAKLLILVFSDNSDVSKHVKTEIAMAFDNETTIIPYKITGSKPAQLKYYLQTAHWLDATDPESNHLQILFERICDIIPPTDDKQRAVLAVSQLLTNNEIEFTSLNSTDSPCYTKITVTLNEMDARSNRRLMMIENEAKYRLQAQTRVYRDGDKLIFEVTHDKSVQYNFEDELEALDKLKNQTGDTPHNNLPIILGKAIDGNTLYEDWNDVHNVVVLGSEGSGKRNYVYSLIHSLMATQSPQKVNFAVFGETQYYDFLQNSPYLAWEMGNYSRGHVGSQLVKIANARLRRQADEDCGIYYEPLPELFVILDEVNFDVGQLNVLLKAVSCAKGMHFIISSTNLQLNQPVTFEKLLVCHTLIYSEDSIANLGCDAATALSYASGDVLLLRNGVQGNNSTVERLLCPYVGRDFMNTVAQQSLQLKPPRYVDAFDTVEKRDLEKLDELEWRVLMHFSTKHRDICVTNIFRDFNCGSVRAIEIFEKLKRCRYVSFDNSKYFSCVSDEKLFLLLPD